MASRVFYASGAGPGGADAAAGAAGRPRQQQYAPRRSVEPEGGRERRPPQQLYVPPRHRQGGASSGFNRASSPGLSTRSEIVTSWRVHATPPPPRCASPGPLSPGSARPPAGPRRRLSHQASWESGGGGGGGGGGAWKQSGESLSQSRPSSRQSSVEPGGGGGGSPRKRSGRRRRRSGRRSRSKSEDRAASAAEPMSPEQAAPWRHGHRDSWDGGHPAPTARPPSPRGPARPRFQQVYVPPPRRGQESPAPAAAAPPRAPPDWPSPARQAPATGRGRGVHTPQRVASPAPAAVYGDHRPGTAPTPPPGDGPGSTASLGRRGSRRRRRTRDGPSGGGGSAAQSPAPDRRRSVSPTDLIASLQLESGGAPAPGEPQSPTDVMLHLGVRPSAPLPRTDSLGQLVNTTDDEKVTLGGGRGRGRGRTPRPPGPPGGPAVYLPQSDEVKAAALRRPHSAQAKDRWADAELNAGPLSPSIIMSDTRVAMTPTKASFDTSPRHQDAVIRQSPGRGEQGHVSARPHESQQQQPPRPAVSQPAVSHSAVSQHPVVTSPPNASSFAAVVPERSPAAPAPVAVSAEERTPSAVQSPSAVVSPPPPPPPEPASVPASSACDPDPSPVPVATDSPTSTTDHSSAEAAEAEETLPSSSDSPTPGTTTAASPETAAAGSPEREASDSMPIPERTRRRSASFSGLFNQSLDEPFNWADEVEEWEKRFNDEGDEAAADAVDKTRRSPVEKRQSGSSGSGRSRQQDRSDMDDDRSSSDPSLPAHVIELYGFPPGFSKQDFNVVFADFAASGFDVRPVDDRTALGVFSSAACASQALRLRHPMLLSRPLSQASARSRQKAAQPANVQLPHRARPETSALHAGRMVASALGVRAPSDGRARQRRDNERRKLKDAKDKKRLANKQRDDAWEGRF